MSVEKPRFFATNTHRHLVLSYDYFLQFEDYMTYFLGVCGFRDDKTVTRIDDEDQNLVEFVQTLDVKDSDEDEYSAALFEGGPTGTHH